MPIFNHRNHTHLLNSVFPVFLVAIYQNGCHGCDEKCTFALEMRWSKNTTLYYQMCTETGFESIQQPKTPKQ